MQLKLLLLRGLLVGGATKILLKAHVCGTSTEGVREMLVLATLAAWGGRVELACF